MRSAIIPREALKIFINNLCPVVSYAGKNGRDRCDRAGVQAYCLQSEAGEKGCFDAIGSPNLQIIFDPVNLLDICNYKDRDAIIAEGSMCLARILRWYISRDFKVENNSLVSVAAGTGEMNLRQDHPLYERAQAVYPCNLREHCAGNAVASRKYIQRLWEECHVG